MSGVELIQRVVPREALSQIDSCNLIVIAPIYLQYLNLCLAIGGNVVVGVVAVWNWELSSFDMTCTFNESLRIPFLLSIDGRIWGRSKEILGGG